MENRSAKKLQYATKWMFFISTETCCAGPLMSVFFELTLKFSMRINTEAYGPVAEAEAKVQPTNILRAPVQMTSLNSFFLQYALWWTPSI